MQTAHISSSTTQTIEHKPRHHVTQQGNAPRRPSQQVPAPTTQAPVPAARQDPYYGHEATARLCARFITHLFACPEYPPATTHSQAKLPHFIAYALHRTKLHPSVTFASLILLQRLKARFPTARGSSGHRLFISAFMIASKVICDDTYSNKSWGIVAQGMFSLREVNQMEREMCNYLDWELTVDNPILDNFEKAVRKDFATEQRHYPNYPLTMVSKRAARAAASAAATPVPEPSGTTNAIPNFGQHRQSPSAARPDPSSTSSSSTPPTSSSAPTSHHHQNPHPTSTASAAAAALSMAKPSWKDSTPATHSDPNTPSPSHSNSTSPASSASPQTPVGLESDAARIYGVDASPPFTHAPSMPSVHPLKGQMFAFALPSKY